MSGGVKPSSRAGKPRGAPLQLVRLRNPTERQRRELELAASLYERFSGHDAEVVGKIRLPKASNVGVLIGTLDGVLYTTVRDGVTEKYIHKFKAADKPWLVVSPDGRRIMIVGGSYDFTERGIVDGSDTKTRRELGIR